MQRDNGQTNTEGRVFTSTTSYCSAIYTLGQAQRLGPGRLLDGRILVEREQLAMTLRYPTDMGNGWSFHAGQDGSGLFARTDEGTLLAVAPMALLPQTAGLFQPKPLEHWMHVARALPPCGYGKGWVLPWFEPFEPKPEDMHRWNRWCMGWLLHHQDTHMGGAVPKASHYVLIQAGRLESTGSTQTPRVKVHSDVTDVDRGLVCRISTRLQKLLEGQPIAATLRQHAPPQQTTSRILGSSQYEPLPTSTHARIELIWEALQAARTASISSPIDTTG